MEIGAVSRSGGYSSWAAGNAPSYAKNAKNGEPSIPAADGNLPSLSADGDIADGSSKRVNQTGECQTCKNRKYQDGSDDPGVSFKTPTKLSADQAAGAVRSHEMEHVGRERSKAQREEREVVSQSVVYHTAICPECGRSYVSGGTTRTTTRAKQPEERYAVGLEGEKAPQALDMQV